MEIVKRGQIPEEKQYEATCSWCLSIVRFKDSEARRESGGMNDSYRIVRCPVCGRDIWHEV